jgi:serine/threonine-protein kinase
LLALSLFLAAVKVVVVANLFAHGPVPDVPQAATYTGILIYSLPELISLAIHLTVAWFLWRRPPRTLFGLRVLEFVILAPLLAVVLMQSVSPEAFDFLEAAPREPTDVGRAYVQRYEVIGSGLWFFVITAYGALIPNTLRRAALITGGIAVSPLLLFAVYATWIRPLDPAIIGQVLVSIGLTNAIAVALVLFSTSRIEVVRQQASEARKLGQYVLKENLGSGGMGEVYRAEHALLRRPCALKLIRPERAGDPKNLRRFEREVQATAALTHPNTVQIYDYGHTADGTFYYVMEYLPGPNLEQLVKEHGPLPPERIVHLLRQVCGALREAHAAGLIHRDIKPSNIIVCERGGLPDVAKLLDFGIVDAPDAGPGAELTAQGQLLGTPLFMSAEQAAGMPDLDARSDLYSLGATAYFMATGKAPFERGTTILVIAAHLRDPVMPPHYLRTEVPPDLSAVIQRCLEKDPSQRYPDAASLEKALAGCKCAGRWTEERAVQANHAAGVGVPRVSTTELERRWSC